jgi:hypothetical protein
LKKRLNKGKRKRKWGGYSGRILPASAGRSNDIVSSKPAIDSIVQYCARTEGNAGKVVQSLAKDTKNPPVIAGISLRGLAMAAKSALVQWTSITIMRYGQMPPIAKFWSPHAKGSTSLLRSGTELE